MIILDQYSKSPNNYYIEFRILYAFYMYRIKLQLVNYIDCNKVKLFYTIFALKNVFYFFIFCNCENFVNIIESIKGARI